MIVTVTPATPVTLNVGANPIAILVIAQDGTPKTYTVTVTRNSVFQDWAAANNVGSDPNTLGANGLKNLLNYAFGMDPNSKSTAALAYTGGVLTATGQPVTQLNGGTPFALFVRRKDYLSGGLTYTVEFSKDLIVWQPNGVTPTPLAQNATYEIVSLPFPATFTDKGFFQVIVSLP